MEKLRASKGNAAVHLATEARPLHASSGAVMWQWDPEIRASPGTESPRSLLQHPGARKVMEGMGNLQALLFFSQDNSQCRSAPPAAGGRSRRSPGLEGAEGGY